MGHIYDYAWINRYRNTKFMLFMPVVVFLVNMLCFLVTNGKSLTLSYDTYFYVLVVSIICGLIVDYVTSDPEKYKAVLVESDGVTFGFKTKAEIFVSWADILVIDDFDLNDTVVSVDGKTDYRNALGGTRLISRLDEKFIIYKSIRKYKDVKGLIINNSINAVLKENGRRKK